MDIFAHGLWTGAIYYKFRKKLNYPLAIFFGVFPDLFAFTLPFFQLVILGPLGLEQVQKFEPPYHLTALQFNYVHSLYNISHSLVIFALTFLIAYLIFKRWVWELGGWLLHILIDIPSHGCSFFPTPFGWPLSNFRVCGIPWSEPVFMAINYTALAAVYLAIFLSRRKKNA